MFSEGTILPLRTIHRVGESAANYADVCATRVSHGAHLTNYDQGVSHAEWPEDSDEYAPTEDGAVVSGPHKAMDVAWDIERNIECHRPRNKESSERAKKL
jgi:hypothetical protein